MFGLVPFGSRKSLAKNEDGFRSLFDLFNEPFFNDNFPSLNHFGTTSFKVDVKDTGDAYELTADLPGMKKEDITLHYENNYLTISAGKDESREEKDEKGNYIRRERSVGTMSRSFYIDNIDEAKVTAEFKDGVLRVDMPKAAEVQHTKRIEIK